MKTVVAALIEKNDKYLVAKRSAGNPKMIGKWEFPGGKVEPGEMEGDALIRELMEELGILVEVHELLATSQIDGDLTLKLYRCRYKFGNYCPSVHSDIKWLSIARILKLNIPSADRILCEKLIRNNQI